MSNPDSPTVLFDVDGTLVDSNYHHAIAWFQAFQRYDVTVPVWRIHRAIGMGGDRLVARVAGDDVENRLGDEVRAAWKERYEPMLPEVRGFAGAHDLVAAAAGRGWRVALASSGDPAHVEHYLDLLDLRALADAWTSAGDVSDTKPAPDLLEVALRRAGGGPAVLIGDSVWDCESAERAGLPCVGLLTGGFGEFELRDAGAVAVYEDLPDLRAALDDLPFRVAARS
ncbi:HAD family hydrolase [Actinophytocola sp.]|uniref:HAD family hydrolase n=1 Tax=Actinophytocola sp. TaxID=1872138 RepID=UPI002D7EA316|nr:HAD family hydrolase [Actinophytocola sp.]HET9138334.1 HAD family hydrolase [Actinophytocola sp.]